jgi:hypothetical protein
LHPKNFAEQRLEEMEAEKAKITCSNCYTRYVRGERHACCPPSSFTRRSNSQPVPQLMDVIATGGLAPGVRKDDQGKPPVFRGVLSYFPRALAAVAEVSAFGAKKYGGWGGWRYVPDGFNRYTDGLGRHVLGEALRDKDLETGLLEAAHVAWNALARLELKLTEMEGKGQ